MRSGRIKHSGIGHSRCIARDPRAAAIGNHGNRVLICGEAVEWKALVFVGRCIIKEETADWCRVRRLLGYRHPPYR
jgi:hypothetical protein